jgi:hypothetical protein
MFIATLTAPVAVAAVAYAVAVFVLGLQRDAQLSQAHAQPAADVPATVKAK